CFQNLNQFEEAYAALREALKILDRLHDENGNQADYQYELGKDYRWLAEALQKRSGARSKDADEAAQLWRRSVDVMERLVEKHQQVVRYSEELGQSLASLGVYGILDNDGDMDEAEKFIRKAFEVRKKVAEDYPWVVAYRDALGDAIRDL